MAKMKTCWTAFSSIFFSIYKLSPEVATWGSGNYVDLSLEIYERVPMVTELVKLTYAEFWAKARPRSWTVCVGPHATEYYTTSKILQIEIGICSGSSSRPAKKYQASF